MFDLQPCVECRRHVASIESACPFCGSPREPVAPRALKFRRVSRAALFTGAAIASTACGSKKPKPESIENQQSPVQADAGVEQPDDEGNRDVLREQPDNVDMPYGAPPARRRLV